MTGDVWTIKLDNGDDVVLTASDFSIEGAWVRFLDADDQPVAAFPTEHVAGFICSRGREFNLPTEHDLAKINATLAADAVARGIAETLMAARMAART